MPTTTISLDEALAEPIVLHESDAVSFSIRVPDATSISSPTQDWYKQNTGSDLSSTYLTGSLSVSGTDTIITKTTQNLKAGYWVTNVRATVNGISRLVIKQPIIVKRANEV